MTVSAILKARSSRPIALIPFEEMMNHLADIVIDEAFSLRCEVADPKIVDAIVNLMLSELYTTYNSWCVDEIRVAIRAGVCAQLGPMYKLSPAEFIRIMEIYHHCPMRLEALRRLRREQEKPKPEDPETVERKNRETLAKVAKNCYADVKNYGRITYYSDQTLSLVFDFLLSAEIVNAGTDNPGVAIRQQLEEVFQEMVAAGKLLTVPIDL